MKVQGPGIVDIYINAAINAQPYYLKSDVQAAVEQAVADYLAFENVSFGQAIYLSKIYEVIQELPQVVSLNITRFSSSADVTLVPIETNGVIQLQPYQLPRPGYRDNPQTPPRSGIPAPIDLDIVGGVG